MNVATPFGYLDIPEDVSHARKAAALRALDWCFSIVQESHLLKKGRKKHGSWGASITRKINGKKVAVYPLVAAHYDVGSGRYGSLAFQDHIPVEVNSASVCITVAPAQEASLHTDMVASLLQLLSMEVLPWRLVPKTLTKAIVPEVLAAMENEVFTLESSLGPIRFRGDRSAEEASLVVAALEKVLEWVANSTHFSLHKSPTSNVPAIVVVGASVNVGFDLEDALRSDSMRNRYTFASVAHYQFQAEEDGCLQKFSARLNSVRNTGNASSNLDLLLLSLKNVEASLLTKDRKRMWVPVRRQLFPGDFPARPEHHCRGDQKEIEQCLQRFNAFVGSTIDRYRINSFRNIVSEREWNLVRTHYRWEQDLAASTKFAESILDNLIFETYMPVDGLWAMNFLKQHLSQHRYADLVVEMFSHGHVEINDQAAFDYEPVSEPEAHWIIYEYLDRFGSEEIAWIVHERLCERIADKPAILEEYVAYQRMLMENLCPDITCLEDGQMYDYLHLRSYCNQMLHWLSHYIDVSELEATFGLLEEERFQHLIRGSGQATPHER